MSTLWHGRFAGGPSDELMAFTVSLPFDQRLALLCTSTAIAAACIGENP